VGGFDPSWLLDDAGIGNWWSYWDNDSGFIRTMGTPPYQPGPLAVLTSQHEHDSSTSEHVLFSGTIPAGTLRPGTTYALDFGGSYDLKANPSGTLTIRVRLGSSAAVTGTIIGQALIPSNTSLALSNLQFVGRVVLTVRSASTGGSFAGHALISAVVPAGAGTSAARVYPDFLTGTALDTTVAKDLFVTAQFATSSSSNKIRLETGIITEERA
jgi:hypothetical protein